MWLFVIRSLLFFGGGAANENGGGFVLKFAVPAVVMDLPISEDGTLALPALDGGRRGKGRLYENRSHFWSEMVGCDFLLEDELIGVV